MRKRLIRREKEWKGDRGTVTGGDTVYSREGGREGLGQGGVKEKRQIVIVALG